MWSCSEISPGDCKCKTVAPPCRNWLSEVDCGRKSTSPNKFTNPLQTYRRDQCLDATGGQTWLAQASMWSRYTALSNNIPAAFTPHTTVCNVCLWRILRKHVYFFVCVFSCRPHGGEEKQEPAESQRQRPSFDLHRIPLPQIYVSSVVPSAPFCV